MNGAANGVAGGVPPGRYVPKFGLFWNAPLFIEIFYGGV
jgi:hypothetical protein